jgi:hypothetical protein
MKTALALLLSFAAIACAQERNSGEKDKKRLSSVTWDLKAHKLIWEVQTGRDVAGDFQAEATSRYEITPDEAVMKVAGERRAFTQEEAVSLHKLLDTLSLYCAESVVWWDQGQGRPLKDGEEPVKSKPDSSDGDRVKVKDSPAEKQLPPPRPAVQTRPNLVALNAR